MFQMAAGHKLFPSSSNNFYHPATHTNQDLHSHNCAKQASKTYWLIITSDAKIGIGHVSPKFGQSFTLLFSHIYKNPS